MPRNGNFDYKQRAAVPSEARTDDLPPTNRHFTLRATKIVEPKIEPRKRMQRGFFGNCGSVLFNHVSKWEKDEQWARGTGTTEKPPKMDVERFVKDKPDWMPGFAEKGTEGKAKVVVQLVDASREEG